MIYSISGINKKGKTRTYEIDADNLCDAVLIAQARAEQHEVTLTSAYEEGSEYDGFEDYTEESL